MKQFSNAKCSLERRFVGDPLCNLWLLRTLFSCNAIDEIIRPDGRSANEKLLSAIDEALVFKPLEPPESLKRVGLEDADEDDFFAEIADEAPRRSQERTIRERHNFQRQRNAQRRREWGKMLERMEADVREGRSFSHGEPYAGNLARLAGSLRLDPLDIEIFSIVCIGCMETCVARVLRELEGLSFEDMLQILSILTGRDFDVVSAAMRPQGRLLSSGLIRIDHDHEPFQNKLRIFDRRQLRRLIVEPTDPMLLLQSRLLPVKRSELTLADFDYLRADVNLMLEMGRWALANRSKGVNFLIHGEPGTGKTELVRSLADALGRPMSEIAFADDDGDPIEGPARMRCYRLAQVLLDRSERLILLDEFENTLTGNNEATRHFRHEWIPAPNRRWLNDLLEQNPIPTFWVGNSIDCLESAQLRRFSHVLKMPRMPFGPRMRLFAQLGKDVVGPDLTRRLAGAEHASPAVIEKAFRNVREVMAGREMRDREVAVELQVNGVLRAQGVKDIEPSGCGGAHVYDRSCLETSEPVESLFAGLSKARRGRVCLYGPPGTGKTEFAREVAREAGMELRVVRMSDILSPYVGMAEQHLAEAFGSIDITREALLIDEVDGLLRDRSGAVRSWEVTQVNEFLTCMERFHGLFFATTNLVDRLDAASLRRFDMKVKFGYLKGAQAVRLLERHLEAAGLPAATTTVIDRVSALECLTPGDFASIARRQHFAPFGSAEQWAQALEAECALKSGDTQRRIGFTPGVA